MFVDPSGYVKQGDAERFGEDSAKYKILVQLGEAWLNTDSEEEREKYAILADEIREHHGNVNSNNISSVMIINDEDGVPLAGHNAIILVDNSGEGVYFSFHPEGGSYPYANGQMRMRILTANQMDSFKDTGNIYDSTSVGDKSVITTSESYNRYVDIPITNEQGKKC